MTGGGGVGRWSGLSVVLEGGDIYGIGNMSIGTRENPLFQKCFILGTYGIKILFLPVHLKVNL